MSQRDQKTRHEASDADVRLLATIFAAGLVVVVIASAAMFMLVRHVAAREDLRAEVPSPNAASPASYEGPELEVDPRESLRRARERDRERLTTYGWVDRDAGVVHIPLERAKALLVERGLPPPTSSGAPESEAPR